MQAYHDKYERELEELKNEFISTSPRPFKLKSSKKKVRLFRGFSYCTSIIYGIFIIRDAKIATESLQRPVNAAQTLELLRLQICHQSTDLIQRQCYGYNQPGIHDSLNHIPDHYLNICRRRLEMEMTRKLEEAKLKEEARWREKVMRKKPVWQTLAYSHEEDLAMRCVPSLMF